ncbi:MAG TPA: SGNH/GDSL hydrolase family protein, partial [Planctomycetota bacterium]|nr:SGNH/GDSL hydrolase family protein [Planctomycetota bacterium]
MHRLLRLPLLALGSLAASAGLVEAVARLAPGVFRADPWVVMQLDELYQRGKFLSYVARPYVGFGRPRDDWACNSSGFQDEEWSLAKPPGVVRIACLGGSTTEGGNHEGHRGNYPTLLESGLDEFARRRGVTVDYETLNFGVSGWTTAETLANWFLLAQDYAPDVVVLHHAVNDVPPRTYADYRLDYSHYRKPFEPPQTGSWLRTLFRTSRAALLLRARSGLPMLDDATNRPRRLANPAPHVLEPLERTAFRSNVDAIVRHARSIGATVVLATLPMRPESRAELPECWSVGCGEHNQVLRELAAEHGCVLADLELAALERPGDLEAAWLDAVHVNGLGNAWKATHIGLAVARARPELAA